MRFFKPWVFVIVAFAMILCLFSCEKKKQGKLEVTGQEYVLRKDSETSFTIDARGKIKNVGEVDVKNVVVTGRCKPCSTIFMVGEWFVSPDVEKLPNQKDVISYIAAGDEESFQFEEITSMMLKAGQHTPKPPDGLEVVIDSFETAGN